MARALPGTAGDQKEGGALRKAKTWLLHAECQGHPPITRLMHKNFQENCGCSPLTDISHPCHPPHKGRVLILSRQLQQLFRRIHAKLCPKLLRQGKDRRLILLKLYACNCCDCLSAYSPLAQKLLKGLPQRLRGNSPSAPDSESEAARNETKTASPLLCIRERHRDRERLLSRCNLPLLRPIQLTRKLSLHRKITAKADAYAAKQCRTDLPRKHTIRDPQIIFLCKKIHSKEMVRFRSVAVEMTACAPLMPATRSASIFAPPSWLDCSR